MGEILDQKTAMDEILDEKPPMHKAQRSLLKYHHSITQFGSAVNFPFIDINGPFKN